MATGRATESQEAIEARLSSLRSREASARATETPEAKEAHLANTRSRVAVGRATESEEARDSRLASLRSRSVDARAREMPKATSSRRTSDQGHIRASRLRVWQDKCMAAFNYDPTIDYVNDPMVKIGKMGDVKCPHCKALKWTGETPGMCCAGGKVKLPSFGTLLPGGRTAHSTFKLLLNLATSDSPVCNISKGTGPAKLLKTCKLIVYDECMMAHKKAMEALDQTLRDIRGNDRLMGSVTVLLSGDFRQTLPIIPKGTPADELNACLKASPLWPQRYQLQLHKNMK